MLYGFYFDPTYILIIIGMVLCLAASAHVNSTFNKYSRVRSNSGMTGAQAAQRILESQGIYDVSIRHISGNLTDNYNPSTKVLKIWDADVIDEEVVEEPGTIISTNKTLKVATADGYLDIKELQLQGKKRMDVVSFLNGYKINSTKLG